MNGVNMCLLMPEFKAAATNQEREFFKCIRKLVESGIEQGVLSADTNVDVYVQRIFTMLTGVEMLWCMEDFNENLATLAEDSVHSLVDGLMRH